MSDNENLMNSVRITIRITGEAYSKLEELLKSGEYKNLSEIIRTAIQKFLEEKFSPQNIEKIPVDIPKAVMENIEILIENGDAVNKEDLIRMAVREYVNRRVKEIVSKRLKENNES